MAVVKAEGAQCPPGGGLPDLAGSWFVQPTISADVANTVRSAREEVFASALFIIPFNNEKEAVAIASDTSDGLVTGVWMQNIPCAITVSELLKTGTVWGHTDRAVSFMTPFGGFEQSGQPATDEYPQTTCVRLTLAEAVTNPFVLN